MADKSEKTKKTDDPNAVTDKKVLADKIYRENMELARDNVEVPGDNLSPEDRFNFRKISDELSRHNINVPIYERLEKLKDRLHFELVDNIPTIKLGIAGNNHLREELTERGIDILIKILNDKVPALNGIEVIAKGYEIGKMMQGEHDRKLAGGTSKEAREWQDNKLLHEAADIVTRTDFDFEGKNRNLTNPDELVHQYRQYQKLFLERARYMMLSDQLRKPNKDKNPPTTIGLPH